MLIITPRLDLKRLLATQPLRPGRMPSESHGVDPRLRHPVILGCRKERRARIEDVELTRPRSNGLPPLCGAGQAVGVTRPAWEGFTADGGRCAACDGSACLAAREVEPILRREVWVRSDGAGCGVGTQASWVGTVGYSSSVTGWEPVDDVVLVVAFVDGEVDHESVGCGAVPVLFVGFEEDAVAGVGSTSTGPPRR